MEDEQYWKLGNFTYGVSSLLSPFAAFEIGFRYFGSTAIGISFALPCFISFFFIGKLGTLSELAEDPAWENPARQDKYYVKSLILSSVVLGGMLASTCFVIGLWQLVLLLFVVGTVFHNYACSISNI